MENIRLEEIMSIIQRSNFSNHEFLELIDLILGEGYQRLESNEKHKERLQYSILNKWLRIVDYDHHFFDEKNKTGLISIREHSYRLSKLIHSLAADFSNPRTNETFNKIKDLKGELHTWHYSAEWFEVASGIRNISLVTAFYDDSLAYCETPRNYENARSDFLTEFTTYLGIFIFTWGGLEEVLKMINPSRIPAQIKKGGGNVFERAVYMLKTNYQRFDKLYFFDDIVYEFRTILEKTPSYKSISDSMCIEPWMNDFGFGFDLVRKIRNKLAHGALVVPSLNYDNKPKLSEIMLLKHSIRIILFTVQMMLLVYLDKQNLHIENCWVEWNFEDPPLPSRIIIKSLHLVKADLNINQIPLF